MTIFLLLGNICLSLLPVCIGMFAGVFFVDWPNCFFFLFN